MRGLLARLSGRANRSEDDNSSSSAKADNTSSRRREQVRRAQRTHRERRAKYLKALEDEVIFLRSKDARSTIELRNCDIVNQRLRALLAANDVSIPEGISVVDEASFMTGIEVLGAAGGPQRLRPFLSGTTRAPPGSSLNAKDPQIAIDFVLALEEPCLADFHNRLGEDGEVGHTMQLQASILSKAPATIPTAAGQSFPTGSSWNISSAQLEEQLQRLLKSSLKLNLKGEMTPVMCWNKVQQRHTANAVTRGQLQQLQQELAAEMLCYGFGAVIDNNRFDTIVDAVLPDN